MAHLDYNNDYHDFKKEHPNINGYPEHKFKQFISETPLSVALFILLTAPLLTLAFCISTRKENF
jgi:1,4-dihydroxy-2-naphthoate octaprenyltransferase